MIQTSGATPVTGTEVVAHTAPTSHKKTTKNLARMLGAGVISVGMVGVFALPAYATPQSEELRFYTPVQQLTTADAEGEVALNGPSAELVPVEAPVVEAEEAGDSAAAAAAAAQVASFGGADVPAGVGAAGLVNAALAQVGQGQDCTALVERSLRAIGFGVGDLGTLAGHYTPYGQLVGSGGYAPGDILIWSGRHVAIYIGNGMAVHGGFNGSTVVSSAFGYEGTPDAVVRVG